MAALVEDEEAVRQYLEAAAITDVEPSDAASAQEALLAELPDVRALKADEAGNTHCHSHSLPASGYLRASASGSMTRPAPWCRSFSCCRRTRSRWPRRSSATRAEGRHGT